MTQAWLEQRERSNHLAMRVLVRVALWLGRPVGRLLLYPICFYFVLFTIRSKAGSRRYLARVLGRRPTLRDVFRHFYCFATVALDRMFLLHRGFEGFEINVHGLNILEEARDSGQPCFLLGAHFGSFEALHVFGRTNNIRVTMMMFEHGSRNVNDLARAIDPELDRTVVGMGSVASMLKVSERLEGGDWVGMLGDRRIYDTGAVRVDFLGEPAHFPSAQYRIASIIGRPIVMMIALYMGGNRYDLHFERLVDAPKLDRKTRQETMQKWAGIYVQRLEYYCRLAPYNWFNLYDFWADTDANA